MSKESKLIGDLLIEMGIPYQREYLRDVELNHVNHDIIPEQALIGVEFEWEATKYHWTNVLKGYPILDPYWQPTQDRSLRGDDAIEFKTLGPLNQPRLIPALDGMIEASKGWQASKRTGLHVHLNAGRMTWRNLGNFLSVYSLFEPCIFHAAGDERSANPFTVPLYKDGWVTGVLATVLENPEVNMRNLPHQINKYCALNLASLFTYGTVEFRHLRTTRNRQKIFSWINMILLLHRFSMREDFERVFTAHLATGDYMGLLAHIYGDYEIWSSLVYPDMYEEINYLGADLAYEFYFSRHVKKQESKKKEKKDKKKAMLEQLMEPAEPAPGLMARPFRMNNVVFGTNAGGGLFIQDEVVRFDEAVDRWAADADAGVNNVNRR